MPLCSYLCIICKQHRASAGGSALGVFSLPDLLFVHHSLSSCIRPSDGMRMQLGGGTEGACRASRAGMCTTHLLQDAGFSHLTTVCLAGASCPSNGLG